MPPFLMDLILVGENAIGQFPPH